MQSKLIIWYSQAWLNRTLTEHTYRTPQAGMIQNCLCIGIKMKLCKTHSRVSLDSQPSHPAFVTCSTTS